MTTEADENYFPFEGSEDAQRHVAELHRSPEWRRFMAERRNRILQEARRESPCPIQQRERGMSEFADFIPAHPTVSRWEWTFGALVIVAMILIGGLFYA